MTMLYKTHNAYMNVLLKINYKIYMKINYIKIK